MKPTSVGLPEDLPAEFREKFLARKKIEENEREDFLRLQAIGDAEHNKARLGAGLGTSESSQKLVAGVGFEPTTFRL